MTVVYVATAVAKVTRRATIKATIGWSEVRPIEVVDVPMTVKLMPVTIVIATIVAITRTCPSFFIDELPSRPVLPTVAFAVGECF